MNAHASTSEESNGVHCEKKERDSRAARTVAAAAAGVTAHIGWQLGSRVLSFLLRTVVVRALGPASVADTELNVSLVWQLLVLPVSAFRKVCLRAPDDVRAMALCVVCIIAQMISAAVGTGALAYFRGHYVALAVICVALWIRAFAEPDVVFTVRRERYANNSRARACSVLASSAAEATAVRALPPMRAAAAGHMMYACAMKTAFRHARGEKRPVVRKWWRFVHRDDLAIVVVNYWQYILMFLLGHGEAFVLAARCERREHGAYILAGNFGSIVLRFFHDGLEEQCFNVFQRLAPAFHDDQKGRRGDAEARDSRRLCVATMHLALKASLLVSALFAAVGPAFAYSAICILYGDRWSKSRAPSLLARYFGYLLFAAANGVTEAFFHASTNPAALRRKWAFSAVLALVYIGTLWVVAGRFGAGGVIFVNCANMTARAVYAASFYCRVTGQRGMRLVRGAMPNLGVVGALAAAWWVTHASEKRWMVDVVDERWALLTTAAGHAISGVIACVMFTASLVAFERQFVNELWRLLRGKAILTEDVKEVERHGKTE